MAVKILSRIRNFFRIQSKCNVTSSYVKMTSGENTRHQSSKKPSVDINPQYNINCPVCKNPNAIEVYELSTFNKEKKAYGFVGLLFWRKYTDDIRYEPGYWFEGLFDDMELQVKSAPGAISCEASGILYMGSQAVEILCMGCENFGVQVEEVVYAEKSKELRKALYVSELDMRL